MPHGERPAPGDTAKSVPVVTIGESLRAPSAAPAAKSVEIACLTGKVAGAGKANASARLASKPTRPSALRPEIIDAVLVPGHEIWSDLPVAVMAKAKLLVDRPQPQTRCLAVQSQEIPPQEPRSLNGPAEQG